MHIPEGVISSAPVLAAGWAVAAGGVAVGLRRTDAERIPQVGVLAAAFFVASLIHVPIGPSSVHLVLNGLLGVLLGWAAFPAILIGLLLQAVLFSYGGLTVLGVNTVVMATPAVLCWYAARPLIRGSRPRLEAVGGFAAGAAGVLLSGLLYGVFLVAADHSFAAVAGVVAAAHVPVMIIEGLVTAAAVVFVRKVRPEMLPGRRLEWEGSGA
jgi:cobalt/nickel transport system permease protein